MKCIKLSFDPGRIIRAAEAASRKVLSKAGAFVRRRAQTSIRRRKGISKPGQPPHSHEGTLRKLIFFGVDPGGTTVTIGPIAHGVEERRAPQLLEFGRTVVRRVWDSRRGRFTQRPQRMTYRKRPFMGPALEAELPQLPKRWHNSIRA